MATIRRVAPIRTKASIRGNALYASHEQGTSSRQNMEGMSFKDRQTGVAEMGEERRKGKKGGRGGQTKNNA